VKRLLVAALVLVVVTGIAVVVWTKVARCDGVNVAVFLDPDISGADSAAVRAEIAKVQPDIVFMDQLEAYREFRGMFSDAMPSVEPGDLPTSYRATVDKDDAVTLQRRLLGRPDVETVEAWSCDDDLRRRPPPPDAQSSSRSSSTVRTGSALTGTTLSVVTPASL